MNISKINLENIIKYKWLIIGALGIVISLIYLILLLLGKQNCKIVDINQGVLSYCECQGLEVTVKSTTSSGQQKTICIGRVINFVKYR